MTTEYACAAGDAIIAKIYGTGFPASGQIVVSNSPITAYPKTTAGGMIIPLAETIRDFEDLQDNPVALGGEYRIVVTCRDKIKPTSLGDFVTTLTFTTPRLYTAAQAGFTPPPRAEGSSNVNPNSPVNPSAPAPGLGAAPSPGSGIGSTNGIPNAAASTAGKRSSSLSVGELALVFALGVLGAGGLFYAGARLNGARRQAASIPVSHNT